MSADPKVLGLVADGWRVELSLATNLAILVRPDGLQTFSPERGRFYDRKFDHGQARLLHAEGKTHREIAAQFGVDSNAIAIALNPATARRQRETSLRHEHTPCEKCGATTLTAWHKGRRAPDGRALCRVCLGVERREAVIVVDGEVVAVKCGPCQEWWPPEDYPAGPRYPDLRKEGFASACRSCGSAKRRAYRKRNKVPCSAGCGRMVEGKGRGNTSTGKNGKREPRNPDRPYICVHCFVERKKKSA